MMVAAVLMPYGIPEGIAGDKSVEKSFLSVEETDIIT